MSHGNLQKYRNPNPLQRYLIRRFFRRIAGVVIHLKPRRVLDAGCGEGFVLRRLPPGAAVGVDLSYSALKLASTRSHSVQQADVTHLPFADRSFDLVICLEVLEHLPDSAAGLRELLRVSRRYVLTSVPTNLTSAWSTWRAASI